jgi:hypothetical protein
MKTRLLAATAVVLIPLAGFAADQTPDPAMPAGQSASFAGREQGWPHLDARGFGGSETRRELFVGRQER